VTIIPEVADSFLLITWALCTGVELPSGSPSRGDGEGLAALLFGVFSLLGQAIIK